MDSFFQTIQSFVFGLPEPVQFLGVAAVGAIPFIESYGASTIGIAAGVPIPLAVLAAILGNVASVLLVVYVIGGARSRATARLAANRQPVGVGAGGTGRPGSDAYGGQTTEPLTGKRGRVAENVRRIGVPGAALLGPIVLPTQLTSAAMVGIGANRNVVFLWTTVAIVLWGLAIAALATGLFSAAGII